MAERFQLGLPFAEECLDTKEKRPAPCGGRAFGYFRYTRSAYVASDAALANSGLASSVFMDSKKRCLLFSSSALTVILIRSLPLKLPRRMSSLERVFHVLLDGPAQRAGAEVGAGAFFDQELLGFRRDLDPQAVLGEPLGHLLQLDLDDRARGWSGSSGRKTIMSSSRPMNSGRK